VLVGVWIALAGAVTALLVVGLTHRGDDAAIIGKPSGTTSLVGRVAQFAPYTPTDISGRRVDGGGELALSSFRGRPVLVNYWGAWCAPCRQEAPSLARFARAHPSFAILGINNDATVSAARSFERAHGFTWPSIIDPGNVDGVIRTTLGQPVTVLIDASGQVTRRVIGPLTDGTLATLTAGSL
jgi:thiol-disulfide isomerase/thioredoxin